MGEESGEQRKTMWQVQDGVGQSQRWETGVRLTERSILRVDYRVKVKHIERNDQLFVTRMMSVDEREWQRWRASAARRMNSNVSVLSVVFQLRARDILYFAVLYIRCACYFCSSRVFTSLAEQTAHRRLAHSLSDRWRDKLTESRIIRQSDTS